MAGSHRCDACVQAKCGRGSDDRAHCQRGWPGQPPMPWPPVARLKARPPVARLHTDPAADALHGTFAPLADRCCVLELKSVCSQLAVRDLFRCGHPYKTPLRRTKTLLTRDSSIEDPESVTEPEQHSSFTRQHQGSVPSYGVLNSFAAGLATQHFGGRRPVRQPCRRLTQQAVAASLPIRQASDPSRSLPGRWQSASKQHSADHLHLLTS